MIYEQLTLPICQKPIATVSDFHARLLALVDTGEDSKILEELYSLKSCGWLKSDGLQYCSLKTLLDCLHMRGGATFGTIITTMAELGYSVEWQVLNSKHFGSPQNRPRVFIIGHLGRSNQNRIFPISSQTNGVLKGYQTDTNGKGHKSIQDRFYLKDGIMSCLPHARADTICTTVIDGEPHVLTARERLRLQGSPDDMIDRAYEVNTPIELARQAGNSVTVNVIYEIAKRLELDK